MARVPTYDQPQQQLQALPQVRQQGGAPAAAFGDGGRTAAAAAGALDNWNRALEQERQLADQVRVDEALNQWKEKQLDLTFNQESGFTTQRGAQAMYRQSGKPLADEYYEQADQFVAGLESSLGNDRQKQMFRMRVNDQLTSFRGDLMRYESDQFRNYQLSVQDGKIATDTRTVASYYNNPERIDQSIQSIRQSVYTSGRLQGWSAEQINARTAQMVSAAHLGAIEQAMGAGSPLYADQYLKTYKDQLLPEDMLRARSRIGEQVETVVAQQTADQAFTRMQAAQHPTDMDRVLQITMQTESGGRRYGADGGLLTSQKGAQGEMQVMPGTGRDPGFGVRPAKDNSPEELARVGRDYMGAMVQRYGGDLAQAWAAYNAGPGAVDEAIAKARKEGTPASWLSRMPQETQAYVRKNTQLFATGGGRQSAPTIEQLKAELRSNPVFAERPTALRKAEDELERRYADYQRGVKQRQDEAYDQALQFVDQGGSFDALPANVRQNLDPSRFSSVRDYEKKVRTGAPVETDLSVYQLLASNPQRVRDMSDTEFNALRTQLAPGDFKHFADMRADKVSAKDNPQAISFETLNQVLNPRLRGMNLPTGSTGSPADQQRVGAIRQHLTDMVLRQQQSLGRKLTQGEVVELVDREFLNAREMRVDAPWYLPFGDPQVRKVRPLDTKVGDIPRELRRQIEADYKAQGIDKPSDQEILRAFLALTSTRQRE